jgi:hypothetical protein
MTAKVENSKVLLITFQVHGYNSERSYKAKFSKNINRPLKNDLVSTNDGWPVVVTRSDCLRYKLCSTVLLRANLLTF